MGRLELKKGTKITCPQCKAEIAVVLQKLDSLFSVPRDKLKWLQEPYSMGHRLICRRCFHQDNMQVTWLTADAIHTENGWKP